MTVQREEGGTDLFGLRVSRLNAGLSQAELARRAGVSRQLVGAVEAGRHRPRIDAALALAAALGVGVEDLFAAPGRAVDVVSGAVPATGSVVRLGQVGARTVTAPARTDLDGWDAADAIVEQDRVTRLGRRRPGLVVAGCEPGLVALERLLREQGAGAVAVATSSTAALEALDAGRVHAAVVHGPAPDRLLSARLDVERYSLARWQVGLAAPAETAGRWWKAALAGSGPVVQREAGAGVQRTFERVAGRGVSGPRVGTHLEAARAALLLGWPAVTIEPAARAVGAAFHPLEVHEAQLWCGVEWSRHRVVADALNVICDAGFQRRLAAVGGYDLTRSGTRVA